ncbi:unnamed protein product [Moneuplotes crassus]|uniref:Uncharacterized protein n=1 Tax=Euplotes crassus TaxID=5936 RepID=A0AAD1XX78_EUPCR|nr:unnamed protein product [Moneuplotes crassus]
MIKLKMQCKETGERTFQEFSTLLKRTLSPDNDALLSTDQFNKQKSETFVYETFKFLTGKLKDLWKANITETNTSEFKTIVDMLRDKKSFIYYLKDKEKVIFNSLIGEILKVSYTFNKAKEDMKKGQQCSTNPNQHLLNDYSESTISSSINGSPIQLANLGGDIKGEKIDAPQTILKKPEISDTKPIQTDMINTIPAKPEPKTQESLNRISNTKTQPDTSVFLDEPEIEKETSPSNKNSEKPSSPPFSFDTGLEDKSIEDRKYRLQQDPMMTQDDTISFCSVKSEQTRQETNEKQCSSGEDEIIFLDSDMKEQSIEEIKSEKERNKELLKMVKEENPFEEMSQNPVNISSPTEEKEKVEIKAEVDEPSKTEVVKKEESSSSPTESLSIKKISSSVQKGISQVVKSEDPKIVKKTAEKSLSKEELEEQKKTVAAEIAKMAMQIKKCPGYNSGQSNSDQDDDEEIQNLKVSTPVTKPQNPVIVSSAQTISSSAQTISSSAQTISSSAQTISSSEPKEDPPTSKLDQSSKPLSISYPKISSVTNSTSEETAKIPCQQKATTQVPTKIQNTQQKATQPISKPEPAPAKIPPPSLPAKQTPVSITKSAPTPKPHLPSSKPQLTPVPSTFPCKTLPLPTSSTNLPKPAPSVPSQPSAPPQTAPKPSPMPKISLQTIVPKLPLLKPPTLPARPSSSALSSTAASSSQDASTAEASASAVEAKAKKREVKEVLKKEEEKGEQKKEMGKEIGMKRRKVEGGLLSEVQKGLLGDKGEKKEERKPDVEMSGVDFAVVKAESVMQQEEVRQRKTGVKYEYGKIDYGKAISSDTSTIDLWQKKEKPKEENTYSYFDILARNLLKIKRETPKIKIDVSLAQRKLS